MDLFIWIGIVFCISQSAMFSGLNLAFFSISKLLLEIESKKGNKHALKIATLREDSNFLLTTILWGNVGINVLLTLLSNSVMAGIIAFTFSTVIITFLGEIIPQAYFSRHAMKTASLLSPILRFYQFLLYPVAKPTSLVLDKWLGAEAITFFREEDLRELLKLHMAAPETDIDKVEGKGALNFLAIDDLLIVDEGEPIDSKSIIELPFKNNKPIFSITKRSCEDPFLKRIQANEKKWIILTDATGEPQLALDSDAFLRSVLSEEAEFNPLKLCHRPIIFRDSKTSLGEAIVRLKVYSERLGDDVVDDDIILFWGDEQRRVITGSDVLGRLLRGIAQQEEIAYRKIKYGET
jgi:metal transporter CNNM